MSEKIKAVFLDVDGTIRSLKTKTIPPSALEAIGAARKRGVLVFLATSRAVQFLNNVEGIVEYDGVVALTGAHCVDSEGVTISTEAMDQGDVRAYVKYCDEHANPLVAYASDRIFVLQPGHPHLVASMNLGGVKYDRFLPFDDAFSDRILQFTAFFHAGEEEAQVMAMMPHSHTERWHPEFTDILHNGANKGTGLRNMAAHFGIPVEQTLAMGDGGNDVPMLKAAGIGVAMGNAKPDVQARADYVTADCDNDGLSKAFAHFGII